MVLSPDECLKLTETEEDEVIKLEQQIDLILRAKYDSPFSEVNVGLGAVSARVLKQVIADYRAAGWQVNQASSAKEPQSLIFKKAQSSSYSDPREHSCPPPWHDR